MMRDIIAAPPAPKMNATKLKLNKPTSNHTRAPIITSENAIIVVIFIYPPFTKSLCGFGVKYTNLRKNVF